ncbi:MAG: hypothetical protein Q4F41_18130 [Eubacteriales bacterium]|nr:hypothetical protein [Eubacteriales bacterium]
MNRKKIRVCLWILMGILLAAFLVVLIRQSQRPETMEGTFVQAFRHIGDRCQI